MSFFGKIGHALGGVAKGVAKATPIGGAVMGAMHGGGLGGALKGAISSNPIGGAILGATHGGGVDGAIRGALGGNALTGGLLGGAQSIGALGGTPHPTSLGQPRVGGLGEMMSGLAHASGPQAPMTQPPPQAAPVAQQAALGGAAPQQPQSWEEFKKFHGMY